MCEIDNTTVVDSLATALENMAFVALEPLEGPLPPATDAQRVSITFGRPTRGRVELLAERNFGAMLMANILGTSPDDPAARSEACDALKELLNVACGEILSRHPCQTPGAMDMGLPEVETLDKSQWQDLGSDRSFSVLNADGCYVAIRLVVTA